MKQKLSAGHMGKKTMKQNKRGTEMDNTIGSNSEEGSGQTSKTSKNVPEEDTPKSSSKTQEQQRTNSAQESMELQFNTKKDAWMQKYQWG